jgi:hypothetical protein
MSTINPTLPTSSFIGNKDFTWWLGTVKNADDKDAKLGRAKVNILGFHKPGEKPSNLPWAMVLAPTDSAGANSTGSAANQLKPGSFVVGFFLDYPDCQQPVVIGTLLSKITPVIDKDSQQAKDYPRSYENAISGRNMSDRGQNPEAEATERVSESVVAAAAPTSYSNPSGQVKNVPIADGKSAGDRTFESNVIYPIETIVNTAKQLRRVPKDLETKLTADLDKEEQTISVESTEKFPSTGLLKINDELIGYNNIEGKKFVLAKRGFEQSPISEHEEGDVVKFIMKSEYLGVETPPEGDVFGKYTTTFVDMKQVVDDQFEFIEDAIWWIVNQIKSFIIAEVTKILNAIGAAAISPFPMFGKGLTEAIMLIIRTIVCEMGPDLVAAILSGIRSAIDDIIGGILDVIDSIKCILDAIFEAIFSLIDIAKSIFDTVNSIIQTFSSIGEMGELSNLSDLNITTIFTQLFKILNLGCNVTTRNPLAITFDSCPIASLLSCGSSSAFRSDISMSGVRGKWNPQHSKLIGTFSETGTMVVMDDTPYNTRLVIEHGPSKSGIHIYDNGDVKVTNTHNKTEVVVKDQEVIVHGNVKMVVDGDYHLKVGRDYHLEVLGMYNVAVNRESKITYAGEHKTTFKNNGRLESNGGLAIVASKVGVSCSGQYELQSPISTSICTEQNHLTAGSFNIISTFYNELVTANVMKVVGGNQVKLRTGTSFESGIGVSNYYQMGVENEWWGGVHAQVGMGTWTENKLAVDQESTTGVTSFTKLGASLDTITGLSFKSTTGLLLDKAEGLFAETGAAPLVLTAPIISLN